MMVGSSRQFLHVDDGAIRDAPRALEPGSALTFQSVSRFRFWPQQSVGAEQSSAASCNQRIKSKRIHTKVGRNRVPRILHQHKLKCPTHGSGWEVTELPQPV